MSKVLQANRFENLGSDCEDVENTEEIIQSAVKAAKKVRKINQLERKNQKQESFINGLINARYSNVETVKGTHGKMVNEKTR